MKIWYFVVRGEIRVRDTMPEDEVKDLLLHYIDTSGLDDVEIDLEKDE